MEYILIVLILNSVFESVDVMTETNLPLTCIESNYTAPNCEKVTEIKLSSY